MLVRVSHLFLFVFPLVALSAHAWTFSNLLMAGTQATLGYAETVALGAQRGLDECREQFKWEKWNCPQTIFTQIFSKNKLPSNREVAFVHAIISAGIVHTVTKNCTMGNLDNCRCDARKLVKRDSGASAKNDFRWGGCSDNVDFAFNLARSFLDEREVGHDLRATINLHNNHIGRTAVRETMMKTCKCHGISGSCTTQTCWMRISDFQTVGKYVKNAYRKAFKLDSNADRDGNSLGRIRKGIPEMSPRRSNTIPSKSSIASPSKMRLAFAEESPDYCTLNATLGSNGTLGRLCSRRKGDDVLPEERKSCRRLCKQCGFRVRRQRVRVLSSCNCKFKWCCQVQCDSCATEELTFTCAA